MRWEEPVDGDLKIKKKFALLPISIDRDVRWLEFCNIVYRFCWDYPSVDEFHRSIRLWGWHKWSFLTDEEAEEYKNRTDK